MVRVNSNATSGSDFVARIGRIDVGAVPRRSTGASLFGPFVVIADALLPHEALR